MSTNDFNPAESQAITGPSVSHQIFRSSPTKGHLSSTLADDGSYVPQIIAGDSDASGLYWAYNAASPDDGALFSVRATGATFNTIRIVSDAGGTVGWDDADTDTKFCLYVNSGALTLKNRSGVGDVELVLVRIH